MKQKISFNEFFRELMAFYLVVFYRMKNQLFMLMNLDCSGI